MWITNASVADVAIVWARAEEGILGFAGARRRRRASAPREMTHKLSLRASVTSELQPRRRPAARRRANCLRRAGLSGPLACLSEARFGIVFGAVGAARDCLETTIEYVGTRQVFDKPLAGYQLTQAKIADMAVELGKAQLLALHLGRLKDEGRIRPDQVSFGKLNNCPGSHQDRAAVPNPVGRQRDHPGIPGDPARQQPRVGADLRGHVRGAPDGHRRGADRSQRLPMNVSYCGRAVRNLAAGEFLRHAKGTQTSGHDLVGTASPIGRPTAGTVADEADDRDPRRGPAADERHAETLAASLLLTTLNFMMPLPIWTRWFPACSRSSRRRRPSQDAGQTGHQQARSW